MRFCVDHWSILILLGMKCLPEPLTASGIDSQQNTEETIRL